jgi:hypothetical protein
MWSCDTCGRPNRSNPLICETCGAAAPGADADQVTLALQRDLPMESHLRALGFWYRLGAIVFGAGFLAMFGVLGRALVGVASLRGSSTLFAGAFGWVAMFVLGMIAGSYILGHYLARFVNGARIAAAVLTIVGLVAGLGRFVLTVVAYNKLDEYYGDVYFARPSLAGPIAMFLLSTIWSIAIAWTLLSGRAAQVCAPTYRTIVARTPTLRASRVKSPFFVVPLVVTLLVAMMVLRLMFALRGYASL